MKKLQSIIHDFYRYLGIPIQFINEKESLILEEGLSSQLKFYCQNQSLISAYQSTHENLVQIKQMQDIHFFIWPFIQQKQIKGHFIVGPFQCQEDSFYKEVPSKPACCIDLIGTTLKMIVNHHSCAVQFNPYIKESIDYIHVNFDKNISLDELCGIININKSYFCSL
ncbi:MAG: helix-turn-helix transcriptional regulator, partial [Turicibacter sp.]